jgi:hypothetical protein
MKFGHPQDYFKLKAESEGLPEEDVTEEEFIALWKAAGADDNKAYFHLGIAKMLGSRVRIGDKLIGVKKNG